ncbi:MAG: glycosyltransferase family 4 protein [Chloroflexota bacterium]|nr:glycosyltransferase family 4 protein [Chloroflexota bacterium]MDQ6908528.1 glycosyltransferase family 4 protein [Chloroflexota bacterium]
MTLCVGFDGAMLRAPLTGSGQYSAALIGALRELSEIEMTLLSPEPLATEPDAVIAVPPRWLASERLRKVWWEQVGIRRAARRAGVDVVHVPYFAAPLRQTMPHVVTVHDVIPLLMPAYGGGRAMRAYLRLVSAGARRAAQVIADSECSRRDAIRVLALAPERVTTIPLAVGAAFGVARDEAMVARLRDQYGLHGKRVIFNVAGLDVRKNIATLLRAFARVSAVIGDDVCLVIGGKAHGNAALYPDPAPLARELGIADRVLFAGAIGAAEKIAFYQLADCYVAPSIYEGFGLTPLEAMACGTPVVAADASCTPEVVGDAGLLVAPQDDAGFADAIIRMLTDDAHARRMRQQGLDRARQFSWERTALATRSVYQRAHQATQPVSVHLSGEQPVEIAR